MKGMFITWIGTLGVFAALLVTASHAREFTNTEGKKMVAEPVGIAAGKVIFQKANGKKFSYDLNKLSQEDQDYLKEWAKTSMKYDIEVVRAQAIQFDRERVNSGGANIKVEQRGYEVFVKNSSRSPVSNIVCCYSLFPKTNDRYAEDKTTIGEPVQGKVTLKAIPGLGETSFKTKPVRLESGKSSVTSGLTRTVMKWRQSLAGANFNFYVGDRLIATHNVGAYKSAGAPRPDEVRDDAGGEE